MYAVMEEVRTAACKKIDFSDNLDQLCNMYLDFNKPRLALQLQLLPDACSDAKTVSEVTAQFKLKSSEVLALFDEVGRLLKFLIVIPASSAVAERSLRTLRRLKTYLRNSMKQERLNHVALLNVYQERVDLLDMHVIQDVICGLSPVSSSVYLYCILYLAMITDVELVVNSRLRVIIRNAACAVRMTGR